MKDAAKANVKRALEEAGVSSVLAEHVAGTSTYAAAMNGGGVVIEFGGHRAVDNPDSLAELAKTLVGKAAPAYDPVAHGKALAEEQKQRNTPSERCFR